jgi:hypothetical protein
VEKTLASKNERWFFQASVSFLLAERSIVMTRS